MVGKNWESEMDEVEHLHATIAALREDLYDLRAELEDIIESLEKVADYVLLRRR